MGADIDRERLWRASDLVEIFAPAAFRVWAGAEKALAPLGRWATRTFEAILPSSAYHIHRQRRRDRQVADMLIDDASWGFPLPRH